MGTEEKERHLLIVEDEHPQAYVMDKSAQRKGFVSEICHADQPAEVLQKLEKMLDEGSLPGCVVVDGLKGRCYDAIDMVLAKNPNAICVVYSGDEPNDIRKLASKCGRHKDIPIYSKPSQTQHVLDHLSQ